VSRETDLIESSEELVRSNYILHEFLAHRANFLAEGSRKHHDLFLMRSAPENFLDITPHVCNIIKKTV